MYLPVICVYISYFILLMDAKNLSGKSSDPLKTKLWDQHIKFQKIAKAMGSVLTETHFETKIKTICKTSGCFTSQKDSESTKGGNKTCPKGWKKFEGNCYIRFSERAASWSASKKTCQAVGANLLTITSKRESDWIYKTFKAGCWIDATDTLKEGTWKWSSNGNLLTYTAWDRGEPNNAFGNEDCAYFVYSNGRLLWNDIKCSAKFQALCKKSMNR